MGCVQCVTGLPIASFPSPHILPIDVKKMVRTMLSVLGFSEMGARAKMTRAHLMIPLFNCPKRNRVEITRILY